jgi:hypothetical protein
MEKQEQSAEIEGCLGQVKSEIEKGIEEVKKLKDAGFEDFRSQMIEHLQGMYEHFYLIHDLISFAVMEPREMADDNLMKVVKGINERDKDLVEIATRIRSLENHVYMSWLNQLKITGRFSVKSARWLAKQLHLDYDEMVEQVKNFKVSQELKE